MKLTIKYFASLRDALGLDEEIVYVDTPDISIERLRAVLASRDARSHDVFNGERPVRVAVNFDLVDTAFVVRGDSEVAFFPPVTGG
ncbi:MoaD/ThiS family protein [Pandoraea commovens]|uniref:Molybdopterin synthase sulfur carrier subunit n=1 Tax=Pandoraea commovens TaxID=2508289 RepID=A0A5E4XM62_9BURK|nr:MoaD/ThiS family protein [Pandoraea commovens]UVA80971.1 MoaD/ThiS family protein [Pandoraea commovens]VVE37531.1 molybdenum cofactor biosynthesis protein MoaD [Pandoraea commovens]